MLTRLTWRETATNMYATNIPVICSQTKLYGWIPCRLESWCFFKFYCSDFLWIFGVWSFIWVWGQFFDSLTRISSFPLYGPSKYVHCLKPIAQTLSFFISFFITFRWDSNIEFQIQNIFVTDRNLVISARKSKWVNIWIAAKINVGCSCHRKGNEWFELWDWLFPKESKFWFWELLVHRVLYP